MNFITKRFIPETLPSEDKCAELFNAYIGKLNQTRSSKSILDASDFWAGSSLDDICATIGFTEDNRPIEMRLGDKDVHALVGGTTGSGKSNLLHAIIHSLAYRYSPDELELFLLDFKDGLEFGRYTCNRKSGSWLPHARLIATNDDPQYMLSMFESIQAEWHQRKEKFGQYGSFYEFRKNGGKMPRILILIDECQEALKDSASQDAIIEKITRFLKQGRAYGTHLLLATQTLRGLPIDSLLSQIRIRLALNGAADDRILDDHNDVATAIHMPRCIFNNDFGRINSNQIFQVPFVNFAEDGKATGINRRLKDNVAKNAELQSSCRVFDGHELPNPATLYTPPPFDKGCLSFCIGATVDFDAKPVYVKFPISTHGNLLIVAPKNNSPISDHLSTDTVVSALQKNLASELTKLTDTEIVYYNPNGECPEYIPETWARCNPNDPLSLPEAIQGLCQSYKQHKFLIIERFEDAHDLHATNYSPIDMDSSLFQLIKGNDGTKGWPFHLIVLVRNGDLKLIEQNMLCNINKAASGERIVDFRQNFAQKIAINLSTESLARIFPYRTSHLSQKVLLRDPESDDPIQFLPFKQ